MHCTNAFPETTTDRCVQTRRRATLQPEDCGRGLVHRQRLRETSVEEPRRDAALP